MALYKDHAAINHRNIKEYDSNLKDLAEKIKNAKNDENGKPLLKNTLLDKFDTDREHNPNHDYCTPVSGKNTEKRICRCMNYYGKDTSLCDKCELCKKWRNVGKLKIIDYEVPMKYVITGVGGIDLLLDDGYAVEVKPYNSKETLVRMFAEILTYTIDIEYNPAICFFEGSAQMRDFKRYIKENNTDLELIMKYVKVFYFSVKDKNFADKNHSGIYDFEIKPIEKCEEIYGK